jgi:hypothetical protein
MASRHMLAGLASSPESRSRCGAFIHRHSTSARAERNLLPEKFVRGEDHDIKSGTIGMIQAEIVKRLIAENPHLAAEDKLSELTKAVATIYDRTVVTLTNEDVPF